jgi:hypothetical protein
MPWDIILGGITGLVGSAVTSIFNFKTEKLRGEIKIKTIEAETSAMIEEAKANIAITKATVEGEVEIVDSNAFMQSQKEGNKALFGNKWIDKLLEIQGGWRFIAFPVAVLVAFLFGLVDFLRGLMRPVLTIYLVALSSWITYKAYMILQMTKSAITASEALAIFTDSTSIIIYLTVSCVTWWFGSRQMAKSIMQMNVSDNKPTKKNDYETGI